MRNKSKASLRIIRVGLVKLSFSAITMIAIAIILSFITACSNRVVPKVPEFTGDCSRDLDNVVKYYILPIERSK